MPENKRKVVKRGNFGVKTKRLKAANTSSRSLSLSASNLEEKSVLHKKNKVLAATLNDTRLQNTALAAKINSMNGDLLELRLEVAELKKEKQTMTATARSTEAVLAGIINPITSN